LNGIELATSSAHPGNNHEKQRDGERDTDVDAGEVDTFQLIGAMCLKGVSKISRPVATAKRNSRR